MKSQRTILVAAAWLVGVTATAVGTTLAVNALGAGLLGPTTPVLNRDDVRRALDRTSAAPSGTTPADASPTAAPATGGTKVLTSTGGTIVARCVDGMATLVSWSPAQGYRVDDFQRGPAAIAMVRFKAGRGELVVTVRCVGNEPLQSITNDDN